jgi:serine phosphatase RsbU (regulator of sigma subunit)
MIHSILTDLRDFSGDNDQSDDITIVVVKVKGGVPGGIVEQPV